MSNIKSQKLDGVSLESIMAFHWPGEQLLIATTNQSILLKSKADIWQLLSEVLFKMLFLRQHLILHFAISTVSI